MSRVLAGIGAVVIDRIVGEPPDGVHPVVWFGSTMSRFEASVYRDSRAAGAVHAAVGATLAGAAGIALSRLLGGRLACVAAGTVCVAGRMLEREAVAVHDRLIGDDLEGARRRLSRLVGRDTADLDESAIARATIETVGENTVDAVIGSMWWLAVAGAPGVLVHRAVNTMDAMVGHRNERYERYGWAAAKLDDVMNWIPARLSVAGAMLSRPTRSSVISDAVRRDAPHHPSPNGGVIEAAFAASLDVSLGGVNRYGDRTEDRGRLGTGRPPTAAEIVAATRLARDTIVASAVLLVVAREAVVRCVR